jgi:hypothetical protein
VTAPTKWATATHIRPIARAIAEIARGIGPGRARLCVELPR